MWKSLNEIFYLQINFQITKMKFHFVFQLTFFFSMYFMANGLKGTAQLTNYNSYAPCCPKNPNYDPKASKEECDDYSAWY